MTSAAAPAKSCPLPPERSDCAEETIFREVYYPMTTQPRPVRIVYLADPATLACAMLTDPLAVAQTDLARQLLTDAARDLLPAPSRARDHALAMK